MKKSVFMVLLLLLGIAIPTFAQLKVTLNMSSRPDPYLSNWAQRKETVIVTVINSGSTSIRAKFDCKINKDGSLIVNTKPEKMKILDIPSGVSQYYGEDLVPFEAAKIKDGADQTAIKTGMLPAGSYEFCCALLDPQDKQLTAPVCKSFTLQSYQAPVLLQPEDKSILAQNKRPMFRWTGISPRPQFPIKYRLQVFEVLPGQTPINAFRANRPILDRGDIMATQFQWPADVEMPSPKLQHIWTVRALDDKDNSIGEPYGYATPFVIEPCCLKYGDVCCPPDDVTDNGGGVTAKQDKGKDSTKVGGLNPGKPTGPIGPAVPTGNPKLVDIELISPTEEQPTKDVRPIFKWRTVGEKTSDMTYTFVFGEIDSTVIQTDQRWRGNDVVEWPFSGKEPNVRKGFTDDELKYPVELPPLDPAKSYAWFVIGVNSKGEKVAQSSYGLLTPLSCLCWFPMTNLTPIIQSICLGTPNPTFIQGQTAGMAGCFGPWIKSCIQLSGSPTTPVWVSSPNNAPRYQINPAMPGAYTFRITLSKGTCTKSMVFTINVYPTVGMLSATSLNICNGQDNTLYAQNTNPPGTWATIVWDYRDLPSLTWNTWTGNLGANPNTNPIQSPSCSGTTQFGTRIYRARINPSNYGLPPAPPGVTCSESTIPITIWCPSSAAVTCTGTSSGHTILNNKICSDKNGNGADAGDYPINLIISSTGIGGIISSSVTKTGGGTYTWNGSPGNFPITSVMGAGTYTFTVTRQNGAGTGLCPAVTSTYAVEIKDPLPPPTVQVIEHNEVGITPFTTCPWTICPNETGKLQVLPITGGSYPANTVVKWEYQAFSTPPPANCANCPTGGTWITAVNGINSINQNTNQTGPIGSNWTHVWWRVSVSDIDATCPALSFCYLIKIKPLPCKPVNLIASPALKCVGATTTLTSQIGTGANCGIATSYDWYLDGVLVANTPTLSYSTTLSGNWSVVAKNDCGESEASNICVVRDRILPLTLSGPCCAANSPGSTIPLTITWAAPIPAIPSCPPAVFRWRSRTLPSGSWSAWVTINPSSSPYTWNVPKPTSTTLYEVEYTRCGCTSKAEFTVTACP